MQTIATTSGPSTPLLIPPAPTERETFLAALANLDATQSRKSRLVHFAAGDLAKLVGISPRDVIDFTAEVADHWWHNDESGMWFSIQQVRRWCDRACHGNEAQDVMIALVSAGHEAALADAFFGEAVS